MVTLAGVRLIQCCPTDKIYATYATVFSELVPNTRLNLRLAHPVDPPSPTDAAQTPVIDCF